MSQDDINRCLPHKKLFYRYPLRHDKIVFDEYKIMINNKVIQENYKKWKNGINFKTNRKITIGGKIHDALIDTFMVGRDHRVLFEELNDIDEDEYMKKTKIINDKIDKKNISIEKYNELICDVSIKINKLKKWNDFIIFEGDKYGIPSVFNNIHRENDCFGKIKEENYESCQCHCCENWFGCSNPAGTQYYKCEKCDYKYSKTILFEKNYKGK